MVCLGDSVTMGFGLPREQSWPSELERWLETRGVDAQVTNRAAGGSKVGHVAQRDAPWLARLPEQSRPLVLLMVGHNDLLAWGGMGGLRAGAPPPPGAPAWEPRLLRLLRWGVGMAREELPQQRISEEDVQLFTEQVRLLSKAARGRGGELVLLTYLIPGEAPADAEAQWAEVLAKKREHQLAINDLLRRVAATEQLPLMDLARGVPVPGTWDPAWFLDDVHLAPEGARRVAEAVGGWLETEGKI